MAKVRVCASVVYPFEYRFASKSQAGTTHTTISESILNDSFCTCPGWQFRGTCSHVEDVVKSLCNWVGGPSENFVGTDLICPSCGGEALDYEVEPEYT